MKNVIDFLLAALALWTFINPFRTRANPIEDASGLIVKIAPSQKGRAIELRIANLQKKLTKVKVMDVTGYSLLSQTVHKEDGFSSRISLDNLPVGDYVMRIEHPDGSFNHAFRLGAEVVSFFEGFGENDGFTKLVRHKDGGIAPPGYFSGEKNNLNVNLEKLNAASVRVHVCNTDGKIYWRKKFKGVAGLKEQFDMENLPKGEFMLVVRSDDQTFIQLFNKTEKGLQLKNTLFSRLPEAGRVEIYSQR